MDKFLGRSLGAAALLAGAGIFYHYVIHLPGIDREKKAAVAEAAAALEAAQKKRATQYQMCMYVARQTYDANWANACKDVAATNAKELKNCLATPSIVSNPYMGRQWCQQQYGDTDSSEECTLPGKRADAVNQYYTDAKKQCEIDSKIGA